MGLIERMTGKNGSVQTPSRSTRGTVPERTPRNVKAPANRNRSQRAAVRVNHSGGKPAGLPMLKRPNLPPGRAAILIACTRTKRAYWHVFKREPASTLGWEWERHLTAVPDTTSDLSYESPSSRSEVSTADYGLDIGGRDWGDWYCPGCGQDQIPRGTGNIHLDPCKCGIGCCLGPGQDKDENPECPNCGDVIKPLAGPAFRPISGINRADTGESNQGIKGGRRKEIE